MKKIFSYLLACVLIAPMYAAGWMDNKGKAPPDKPDRKSMGDFGAWLVLTDNETETYNRWDTPSENAYISSAEKIERGKLITALILFNGCAVDENGYCNLVVDFKLVQPDGKIYADLPPQEAWIGKPAPNERLGMSIGYMRVIIEPGELLGKYTVRADVRDNNLKKTFKLKSAFEAVERNALHNMLFNKFSP